MKYARIIKRSFNGTAIYFTQLICEGKLWIKGKNKVNKETIELEIEPQNNSKLYRQKKNAKRKVFAYELKQKNILQQIIEVIYVSNPSCYQQGVLGKTT